MLSADTNSTTWAYIISEYETLIDEYHWSFKPMLELAQELSRSVPISLYPSMSHEHLGFSLVPDYPQCVHLPQVWISYLPQNGSFKIMFREFLRGPQKKTTCQPQETKGVIEAALAELLARRPKQEVS